MTIPPLLNPLPLNGPSLNGPGLTPPSGAAAAPADAAAAPSFAQELKGALNGMEQMQTSASAQVAQLVGGGGQDLSSGMIAVEKADLAFGMMLQLRNKAVSAYQDISHMNF